MLTLFVKEIPTDITKLETKNIRKTRSTANQFDAETLTQALQTKVERHAQSQLQNGIIVPQRDSYGHHKTGNKNHQILDPQKSISCRHNEPRTWINETKCTQSQLKHYHCSSKRFLYTSRNWNQKSQRMTQSTVKQSYAGTLTQTMLSDVQRNARTFSCKTLPLFVKEIPTDVKKMETKVIWKTRSTAKQFDARTLTEALQTELEKNAQTVSNKMLSLFVRDSYGHHEIGNKNHQEDTIHSKSIWCSDIDWSATNWSKTKCTDTRLQNVTIVCQKESYGHHKIGRQNLLSNHNGTGNKNHQKEHNPQPINLMQWHWLKHYKLKWDEMQTLDCKMLSLFVKKNPTDNTKLQTKIIRKTRSTANQFDAETLAQALPTKVERHAQTVSYKMLLLFVKKIPTDITKLETKIIKNSIHKKSISCRHNEPRSWIRIETKRTQSQLKHYHCSSKRFLYTSRNWNQKSQPRTQSTVKQSDAGTLTETMSSDVQRKARTFSSKMLSLILKEIPTDITKLETKIIRQTRSTANQFDAATLTEVLQTEVGRNAQTLGCKKLPLFVKKNPTVITKLEGKTFCQITTKLETKIIRKNTIHSQSI